MSNSFSKESTTPPKKSFEEKAKEILEKRKVTISEYDLACALSEVISVEPIYTLFKKMPFLVPMMMIISVELKKQLFGDENTNESNEKET